MKKDRPQPSKSSCLPPYSTGSKAPDCTYEYMITVIFKDCNDFSQNDYDCKINELQLHRFECTCGKKGCLIRYGHYKRSVKFQSVLLCLSIQRVFCTQCWVSHALIPSILVPYSQVILHDQQQILDCSEKGQDFGHVMESNLLIDENNIKYIIRQFKKHWKQRLLSAALEILDDLTSPCLCIYSRQFMQIHRTRNKLCPCTNIA